MVNPWSLYEHKPQLVQSVLVGVVAWLALRRASSGTGAQRIAAFAALVWSLLGGFDYAVYAFGYQLAKLTHKDVEAVQLVVEWIRIPIVLIGVVALYRVLRHSRSS